MNHVLRSVAFLAAAAAALGEEPVIPTAKSELFNGKDFSGWTLFLPGGADVTKTWSITNGVIRCTGRPAGYLRTEKAYANYKLTVEWRFLKPGNTGVLVHMQGEDKVWPKSIECQGMHGNQGDFFVIDGTTFNEHKGRDGRRVAKNGPSHEKPLGEWNTYEIVCDGDTVIPSVNGREMNRATGCSVTSGRICLQSEGSEIEIRRVTLEPAKKS